MQRAFKFFVLATVTMAAVLAANGRSKAELPLIGPGGLPEVNIPVPPPAAYTATFDGVTIDLYLINGLYQGTLLVNGDSLDVVYSPWWNAGALDLNDPADVAQLGDRVTVDRAKNMVVEQWKYNGPALATWNVESGTLNGAVYGCKQTIPNQPQTVVNCTIVATGN